MRIAWIPLLIALALAAGCAHAPTGPGHGTPPDLTERHGSEEGMASFYGAERHGRRTASGARFDAEAMTAAHPTLPFGTRVRVTNLANGKSIVVRITDRGPFRRGRIIDVSRHAARKLGFLRDGTARVRVQVLSRGHA
jgi:rare lipoprotein A